MEKNQVWLYCRIAQKDEVAIKMQKERLERLESYVAEQSSSIVGASSY